MLNLVPIRKGIKAVLGTCVGVPRISLELFRGHQCYWEFLGVPRRIPWSSSVLLGDLWNSSTLLGFPWSSLDFFWKMAYYVKKLYF